MLRTIIIGKKVAGVTQLTQQMVMSGDKIVLVDEAGQAPKHITTKTVGKDLHIFADGTSEPSAILNDYSSFENSVQIQGLDQGGAYYNYTATSGGMELASAPVAAPVAAATPVMSTSAWWGVGILAVAGGVAAAAGGGGGGDSTTPTAPLPVVDPTAPTAIITISDVVLNTGETATVTIVFSEAVTGFSNADITVPNGTVSTFSSSDNITWTAIFTPTTAIADTTNVITLAAGSYTSSATSKVGAAATSVNYEVDTTVSAPDPLTVTITDDQSTVANIAGTTVEYTFTFSAPVVSFNTSGITVTHGTPGTLQQQSSTVYKMLVTPEAGFTGEMTAIVTAGAAVTSSGNLNIASITSYQTVDMLAPTVVSATLMDTALTAGETTQFTVVFSEAVTNFSNATIDLTGANGTLSTLTSADKITWTALFTPAATTSDTTNVIRVLNTYTDLAGNSGALGASLNFTVDTTAIQSDTVSPILIITDDETMVTANMDGTNSDGSTDANGADILYVFTFSEAVTNFTIDDIVVTMQKTDGTIESTYTAATDTDGVVFKTFEKVSDNVYTLSVRPEAGYEGVMKVSAETSDAVDITGNAIDTTNISTLSSLQTVDMRAPFPLDATHVTAVTPIQADPTHQRIILTFDENLEQVNQTAPGNFGVIINGDSWTVKSIGVSDNSIGMADNQVFLYFDSITNARGELFDWTNAGISVSYTDGTTDITSVIQDLAGNDATSFTDFNSDTLAPNALIAIDDTILSSGNVAKMTVSFSEAVLSLDIGDFTVQNGFLENLATANGGKTWTADLKANADVDDAVNIITLGTSYTDANGITGLGATSSNYEVDTLAPTLTGVSGDRLTDTITLTFDEVLDNVNFAPNSLFYVTDGTLTADPNDGNALEHFAIEAVSVLGNTATLTVDPSIGSVAGATWIVTYYNAPGNDPLALQDIYGSDVSSFTRTAVI
ncbi:MAG: Ig-like domain-containing protein [Sulfuricurvum sp.]|nr:Ig-like domain-containing protein [Sulfuricurvum sp.]